MADQQTLDLIAAAEEDAKKQIANQISAIENQLNEAAAHDRGWLPEDVFGRYFLPFFAGDDPLPFKVSLKDWILIARNPFGEVNIVRGNTVLFTIPPVLDREVIETITERGKNIADIVKDAQLHTNLSPRLGAAKLKQGLEGLRVIGDIPTHMRKHIDVWNKVFVHYGRKPLTNDAPSSGTVGASNQDDDDDFDFQNI